MINPLVLDELMKDVHPVIFFAVLIPAIILFWYYELRMPEDPDWNPQSSKESVKDEL